MAEIVLALGQSGTKREAKGYWHATLFCSDLATLSRSLHHDIISFIVLGPFQGIVHGDGRLL